MNYLKIRKRSLQLFKIFNNQGSTSSDSELFGRVVKDSAVKGESESRSVNKHSN
jgi:hypothetical protein